MRLSVVFSIHKKISTFQVIIHLIIGVVQILNTFQMAAPILLSGAIDSRPYKSGYNFQNGRLIALRTPSIAPINGAK